MHVARRPDSRALRNDGNSNAASNMMMAITTNNSMSVNPLSAAPRP
jgi:hypothetical protein